MPAARGALQQLPAGQQNRSVNAQTRLSAVPQSSYHVSPSSAGFLKTQHVLSLE